MPPVENSKCDSQSGRFCTTAKKWRKPLSLPVAKRTSLLLGAMTTPVMWNGSPVASDTSRSAAAVVRFTPRKTARYRVVLSLPSSRTHSAFCAMSVLTTDKSRSYKLRAESLLGTLERLETSLGVMEHVLAQDRSDVRLHFHSGSNSWLLMGAILKHRIAVASDPKYFAPGSYLGICVAEASCSDANLSVQTASNRVLRQGTDNGAYSFVSFDGSNQNLLSLVMENACSTRPSLVLSAMLRITTP